MARIARVAARECMHACVNTVPVYILSGGHVCTRSESLKPTTETHANQGTRGLFATSLSSVGNRETADRERKKRIPKDRLIEMEGNLLAIRKRGTYGHAPDEEENAKNSLGERDERKRGKFFACTHTYLTQTSFLLFGFFLF